MRYKKMSLEQKIQYHKRWSLNFILMAVFMLGICVSTAFVFSVIYYPTWLCLSVIFLLLMYAMSNDIEILNLKLKKK